MNVIQKVNTALKLTNEPDDKNQIWLTQQSTLRRVIGISGILLPLVLFVTIIFHAQYTKPLDSISAYYHTRAVSIYTLIIGLLGIFLIIYKGRNTKYQIDFHITSLAGTCAILALILPSNNITAEANTDLAQVVTSSLKDDKLRNTLHFVLSGIFLVCLAWISLFSFPKNNNDKLINSKKLKALYKICGILMLVPLLVIILYAKANIDFKINHTIYWMETVAVVIFGIAWLVKSYETAHS
jgi:F0F1-type ATP synthase assembly protein I